MGSTLVLIRAWAPGVHSGAGHPAPGCVWRLFLAQQRRLVWAGAVGPHSSESSIESQANPPVFPSPLPALGIPRQPGSEWRALGLSSVTLSSFSKELFCCSELDSQTQGGFGKL